MRSRYSAYVVGDLDYVWQTWHPRTRPEAVTPSDELRWIELEIVDTVDGQPGDQNGEVEFRARYRQGERRGTLHERSLFAVRARRWFYLDGDVID